MLDVNVHGHLTADSHLFPSAGPESAFVTFSVGVVGDGEVTFYLHINSRKSAENIAQAALKMMENMQRLQELKKWRDPTND